MRCFSINFGVARLIAFASKPGNGFEKGTRSCVFFKKNTLLLQTILGPFQNGQFLGKKSILVFVYPMLSP